MSSTVDGMLSIDGMDSIDGMAPIVLIIARAPSMPLRKAHSAIPLPKGESLCRAGVWEC